MQKEVNTLEDLRQRAITELLGMTWDDIEKLLSYDELIYNFDYDQVLALDT